MIRKPIVSYMLAVTLAQAAAPVLPAFASNHATATLAAARAAGAQVVVVPVQAPARAVRLSSTEMEQVKGAGWFSWLKVFSTIITAVAAIVGAIVKIWETLRKTQTTTPGPVAGGETVQRNENERYDYASEADYNAGIVQGSSATVTQDWHQTEVWYGGGGSCGGENEREGLYYQQAEMPSC
ncbi:MAG TPA: hypothetical protein VF613_22835 [Longimicrobium sp.]|jgi:hypothetical protein